MKNQLLTNVKVKQQGAALITALVFMGILTMLGISAMRSNTMDVKIHNAMKDRTNAFQCAEAALRQGERFISDADEQPTEVPVGTIPQQVPPEVWPVDDDTLNNLVNQASTWWATNGWGDASLSDPGLQIGCADSAEYIVQTLGGIGGDGSDDLNFEKLIESQIDGYRVSSRSEGVSDKAVVILQSTYLRQFQ